MSAISGAVNQCFHEGCQWKLKDQEIDRLQRRVRHLEAVIGRLADHSEKEFREALHPTVTGES